ncbi:hypothetical protein [Clostridium sp. UBA5988]|uniref:hypothetical protein n=1 Tax=Clostridium sp. UBA5988 TaxID=1946369 RepID=UPI003217C964
MLTQQQMEVIDYLVVGTMTIDEIASKAGCTSRVIYKWKKNEDFKAEWKKRSLDFQSGIIDNANELLVNKLGQAIANVIDIANDKNSSDKVRLDANQYLINRILGNTTTKIEQSNIDGNKETEVKNMDDILAEIEEDNIIIKRPKKQGA